LPVLYFVNVSHINVIIGSYKYTLQKLFHNFFTILSSSFIKKKLKRMQQLITLFIIHTVAGKYKDY